MLPSMQSNVHLSQMTPEAWPTSRVFRFPYIAYIIWLYLLFLFFFLNKKVFIDIPGTLGELVKFSKPQFFIGFIFKFGV